MESVRDSFVCGNHQNRIVSRILGAKIDNSKTVSLENGGLVSFPNEILPFTQLQRLSLYGNRVCSLPDCFFDSFPQLIWLDLRFNSLSFIPRKIKNLSKVKNLLIGHNSIYRLCLELGGMENLIGLNIEGNPLRFPPKNIINRGSKYVLNYLKECYAKRTHLENEIKAQAASFIDPQTYIDELAIENVNKEILSRESGQDSRTTSRTLPSLYKSKLHRRIVEKLRKFHEIRSDPLVHSRQSQRHALTHQSGIKLVSDESVRQSEMKERSRRKRRWDKMCQASALQRWKDREMVDEWKTNYRNKQSSLFSIYQEKLPKEIKEESRKRVQVAPFGVTSEATFVISSAELEKLKTAARPSILPDSRPQPRSGSFVLQLEKDRRAWDKVLIDEISEQVYVLNAKMDNPCLPKVLADAEMDLANALQLQLRLRSRRDVLTQLKTATNPTAFMQ